MKDYFFLEYDIDSEGLLIEKYEYSEMFFSEHLSSGIVYKKNDINIKGYFNSFTAGLPDILDNYPLVVSKEIKQVLTNENNLNFYPITLVNKVNSDTIKNKYFIVNVLNFCDAIDYKESKIKFYTNSKVIREIESIRINDENVFSNLFRLKGLNTEVIINSNIKDKLEKFVGLKFTNILDRDNDDDELW